MQVIISISITLLILAIVLPLFYIYIVSKASANLEEKLIKNMRDELNGLLREFNRSALSNISLLENMTIRVKSMLKEIDEYKISKNKINKNISYKQESTVRRQSYSAIANEPIENDFKSSYEESSVLNMFKLGMSNKDIALELNKPIDEIDMILSFSFIKNDDNDSSIDK